MISKLAFKRKIALELFRKFRNNAKKLHQLDYIFWECTLRCNLNCLHCGSDCSKESTVNDMPIADFINAIDDIKAIVNPNKTMIVFTGGEPLMRNDLEICGKQLYDRGFPWGIVTNGLYVTKQRINSLLQSGLRAVTISLDGMEVSHNWMRGNNHSYKKAIEAIEIMSQIPDFKFDIVTCVNQKNFAELQAIKDVLLSKGVKEWRIFTIFPIGRATEHAELQLTPIQFKQVFDFIENQREIGDIKVSYGCEGFLGNYEGKVRDNFFFCRAGISVASVLIDGSISACPNLRDNFIQGNIYNNSFKDIWENKYKMLRDRSWAKTGICSDCNFFKYCEGNGLHLHDEKTAELLFCHLKRIEEGEKACLK